MSRIKRFFQTALIYFAGNIFSKLVTFFLIPLYTNKLLPSEYGDYDLVITIITLFVAVAFFKSGMECFVFHLIVKMKRRSIILYVTLFTFIWLELYFMPFFFLLHWVFWNLIIGFMRLYLVLFTVYNMFTHLLQGLFWKMNYLCFLER